jgi:hypothetical protein
MKEMAKSVKTRLNFFTRLLLIWNLLSVAYIISTVKRSDNLRIWNINFADYTRSDLFLVVVQGNFPNPYVFHPEIPALTVQPYLPFPFILLKIFDIRIVEMWDINSIQIFAYASLCVALLGIIILIGMQSYWKIHDKAIYFLTYGVLTVPSLYVFSTGNIQGLITFIIFLGFLPYFKTTKDTKQSKYDLLRILSFVSTASTKPQYLIMNILTFIKNGSIRFKIIILSSFISSLVVVFGFWIFEKKILENFSYWAKSLFQFTDPPAEFMVHMNSSLIGNLIALETLVNKGALSNSATINFQTEILFTYLVLTLLVTLGLVKKKKPLWLVIFTFGLLPAVVIPVSFAYSFTIFLIPLGLMISEVGKEESSTINILRNNFNFTLIACSIFLILSPKVMYLNLVPGVADTNLYSCFSSLGHTLILTLGIRLLKKDYMRSQRS